MTTTKIMIADDHILMREGIKELLEFDGSYIVIDQAGNGDECLQKLEKQIPDVLLLDINMPVKSGIDTLQVIRKEKIPVKVLLLTVHNEVEYLEKAINLDADGYILKDSGSAELKKAINDLMKGEKYFEPKLIPILNSKLVLRDMDREKIESLTNRELEVLVQVSKGMFNKEIALNLNISERTVKNHISSIFKKIDVSDRTQAAVFAIKNDIVKIF